MRWQHGDAHAELAVDFARLDYRLSVSDGNDRRDIDLLVPGSEAAAGYG